MQSTQVVHAMTTAPAASATMLRRRGFTLIEIMVVTIILVVVSAMVIPRMTGKSIVTAQLAAEKAAEMLATYASRSMLAAQPVALLRDPDFGTIEVWVLDPDPARPDLPPAWRLDRFSKPLTLPAGILLSEIRVDEQRLVPDEWRIVSTPGLPRPRIELVLTAAEGDDEITVVLEPRASAPYTIQAGRSTAIGRVPVDLDRDGRSKELW